MNEMCSMNDMPSIYMLLAFAPNSTDLASLPLTMGRIKLFNAFPKELHICKETHMALIAGGICHAHVKVLKIRLPVCSQYLLKGFNVKT